MKDEPNKDDGAGALVPVGKLKETTPSEFIQQAKGLFTKKKPKEAFLSIQQAHVRYPNDPYVLSYYGWLQAIVDKRYRSGVENCKSAVALLRQHAAKGHDARYGIVYANLGKAYVAAGKKKDAVEAFQQGLKYDSRNAELQKELQAMGKRKKPVVPFLDRSNPVNKLLGIAREKIK